MTAEFLAEIAASRQDFEEVASIHAECQPELTAVRAAFDAVEDVVGRNATDELPAANAALEEAFIAFRRACALAMGPTESVEANLVTWRAQMCVDGADLWDAFACQVESERAWHETQTPLPARAAWHEMLTRLLLAAQRREVHAVAIEIEMLPDVVAGLVEAERALHRWHGTPGPTACPPINYLLSLARAVREQRARPDELEAAIELLERDIDTLHAEAESLVCDSRSVLLHDAWDTLEEALLDVMDDVFVLIEAPDVDAVEAHLIEAVARVERARAALDAIADRDGKTPCVRCGTPNESSLLRCARCGNVLPAAFDRGPAEAQRLTA